MTAKRKKFTCTRIQTRDIFMIRLRPMPTNIPGLLTPRDAVTVACFLSSRYCGIGMLFVFRWTGWHGRCRGCCCRSYRQYRWSRNSTQQEMITQCLCLCACALRRTYRHGNRGRGCRRGRCCCCCSRRTRTCA